MASFKINQNKIFLNNSSFINHNESIDDYIINHNLNSQMIDSSSLLSHNTSKIKSAEIYSQALKYKNLVNNEFNKSKLAALQGKEKDSIDISKESIGFLQIPLFSSNENPLNIDNEEVSFLRFEDIEKHNKEILNKEQKSTSLPRLYNKYQILKNSYSHGGNQTKSPSKNKMVFDIEVTHNKEIFQGINKKLKLELDQSFINLQNNITQNKKTMVKMPPIRSYPMVKMNKLTFKMRKELEELDTKDQNTTISGITANKTEVSPEKQEQKGPPRFKIYWNIANIYTWKPEVRESASFILDGHKGILYGGLGTKVMDDVVSIDFDNMEWAKVSDSGERFTMGKYGHSAVRYKRKMYVFGGSTTFQSQMRQKECLGEVRSLNLDDFTWTWIKCSGDLIIPRRNHTAETVGKHMIVHGGLNYKNSVLNDLWLFDFVHHRWSQANIKTPAPTLAYHSSACVYYLQRTRLEAYKGIDRKIAENNGDLIKYEGLYIFGGKNAKNDVVSNLYIIEIHKNPIVWFEPETVGKAPAARFGATLNFCPQFGLLVVIGGKDDKCVGRPFFNDICLLNLSNLNWLRLKIFGITLIPARAFHASGIINSKLFIFGGYNSKGYVNNEVNIVEFDAKIIKEILDAEKEKKLLKQLQERILKEKMEKHKKKNKNKAKMMAIKEEAMDPTLETESDEMGGSFNELSPEINLSKQRKGATLLKQSVQQMLIEKNERIKENKWKTLVEQYNHKKFVTYIPLPQIQSKGHISLIKESNKIKRSSTLDNPKNQQDFEKEMKEDNLESFVKKTSSEKNIKVSETLKILNNLESS